MGALSLPAATGLIGSAGGCGVHREDEVEVIDDADNSKRFTGGFDSGNRFRFPDLPPGQYSVSVEGHVLRKAVRVLPGALTDVGAVFVCLGDHPLLKTESYGFWKIEMADLCAVNLSEPGWCIADLGRSGPIQPFDDGRRVFWFHSAADGVYLIPFKDVSFSLIPATVQYTQGCPNATYVKDRIRIDNLPSGSRVCVRSIRGGYYGLEFPEKIAPNQQNATLELLALGY